MSLELEYYRKREQESQALALRAINPDVRAIHLEMAQHYVQRQQQVLGSVEAA